KKPENNICTDKAKSIVDYINKCKEEGKRSSNIIAKNENRYKHLIYTKYGKYVHKENKVDFSELLLLTRELFEKEINLRIDYSKKIQLIIVDEFQDTSTLQMDWLKVMMSRYKRNKIIRNCFMVRENPEHIIKLEQNYRSTNIILEAVNAVIAHNHSRLGKNLWTEIKTREQIKLCQAINTTDEAQHIATVIRDFHQCDPEISLSQIAIRYRTNAQSHEFEQALMNSSIKYRIYGKIKFYQRTEIKNALAYVHLIQNENDNDAFRRIINFPPHSIGKTTLNKIGNGAKGKHCSLFQYVKLDSSLSKQKKFLILLI
ncbi:unnamed protein product, partial [Rotaria sp. Silwood1]